jgi:hypothetical protein
MVNEPRRDVPNDRGAVLIPFAIRVYAGFNVPDMRFPATAYVPAVEIALQSIVARLFNGGERSRQLLRAYVAAVADRMPLHDKLPISRVDEIFWELSDNHGLHSRYLLDPLDARLRRMLEGESGPMQIGVWAFQSGEFPLVRINCEKFEFSDGSLHVSLGGYLNGTVLALTLLFAALSSPVGVDIHDRIVIEQNMHSVYGGERCLTETWLTINASNLLNSTAAEFNFKAEGLSEAAQKRSMCLVQITIDFDGNSPGPIDGSFGSRSELALEAFQQKHNLKHKDVTDAELQRELAKAFHKGLKDMVR